MKATNETKAARPAPKKRAKAAPMLRILKDDEWLRPYAAAIEGRHAQALRKQEELTGGKGTLADWADGHLYFGLHRTARQWVLREWARNAPMLPLRLLSLWSNISYRSSAVSQTVSLPPVRLQSR